MKKTKKIISMLLIVAMVMSLFVPVTFADTTVVASGFWGQKYTPGTTNINSFGTGTESEIVAQKWKWSVDSAGTLTFEAVDGATILQGINGGAYTPWAAYITDKTIQKIVIPEGVTQIGSNLFGLKNESRTCVVELPESLKILGGNVFMNSLIKDINIPSGLERIDANTFHTTLVEEMSFPAGMKTFNENSLSSTRLKTLAINGGTVKTGASNEYGNLKTLSILGNTTLETKAIYNLKNLTSLTLGENVAIEADSLQFIKDYDSTALKVYGKGAAFDMIKTNGIKVANAEGGLDTVVLADTQFVEYDGVNNAGSLKWTLDNTVLTVSGKGEIPSYTAATASWSVHADTVRTVIIEEGVTTIGANAFKDMVSIKEVQMPSTLTSIGQGAFSGNTRLHIVEIPDAVTSIGTGAFDAQVAVCVGTASQLSDKTGYKNYVAGVAEDGTVGRNTLTGANATKIGWAVYGDETNGYTLIIKGYGLMWNRWFGKDSGALSGTETSVAPWYDYVTNIKNVLVTYGITKTTQDMLTTNGTSNGAEGVTVPAKVNYGKLEKVILGDTITTIGARITANSSKYITVYNLPYNLTSIPAGMMNTTDGMQITELFIPKAVTSSTTGSISRLPKLTSLVFEEGFDGFNAAGTGNTVTGGKYIGLANKLKELTIPASVTNIPDYTFIMMEGLSKLVVKNPDTTIADNAIAARANVWSLTDNLVVECAKGSEAEKWANKMGYKTLCYVAKGVLENGMEWSVDGDEGNYNLTVTGSGAMPDFADAEDTPWVSYASGITNADLDNRITAIGAYAFAGCALTTFDIGENITAIGENAFASTVKLNCANDFAVEYARENGFEFSIGGTLSNGTVHWILDGEEMRITGEGKIPGEYNGSGREDPWSDFAEFRGVERIIVGEGITWIPGYAFNLASALRTLVLPDTLETIGSNALQESDNLEFVEIPAHSKSDNYKVKHLATTTELKRIAWLDMETDLETPRPVDASRKNPWTYYVIAGSAAANQDTSAFASTTKEIIPTDGYGKIDGTMIEWLVTNEGTLEIYGIGDLADVTAAPWASYASTIKKVFVEEGITGVGSNLFAGIDDAVIELPNSVTSLGAGAFASCASKVSVSYDTVNLTAGAFAAGATIVAPTGSDALQFAQANGINNEERKGLRLLTIGNSYTEDVTVNHLYSVARSMGIEELKIGNLMFAGRNIIQVYEHIVNNKHDYIYREITSGGRPVVKKQATANILDGITADKWDVITIQPWFPDATYGLNGIEDGVEDGTDWLNFVADYIRDNATNPNMKLAFNMVWSQNQKLSGLNRVGNQNYTLYSNSRPNYGNSQYDWGNIVNQTQTHVLNNDKFDYILPTGTAIENARTSYLGGLKGTTSGFAMIGGMQRDATHIADIGMYIGAMVWVKTIMGDKVMDIDDVDWYPTINYTSGDLNGQNIFDEDVVAEAKWAAKAAVRKPFEITSSENPFKIISFKDGIATIAQSNVVRTRGYVDAEHTIVDDKIETYQTGNTSANGTYPLSYDMPAKVIIAEYDDGTGALVGTKVVDKTLTYDEIYGSIAEVNAYTDKSKVDLGEYTPVDADNNTIKIMLWKGMDTLKPLADVFVK